MKMLGGEQIIKDNPVLRLNTDLGIQNILLI